MDQSYPVKNIPILSASQALAFSAGPMVVFIGGIVGAELAPTPALSTLPTAISVVGLALTTIPAALLMRKVGRKNGFRLSALLGVFASLLAAYALHLGSFALFCLATFFLGANGAFVQQYRFAATESVPPEHSSRAVSLVLVGGMVAGFLGPEIAKRTGDLLAYGEFTASFFILAGMYLVVIGLMSLLKPTLALQEQGDGLNRPLRRIAAQPSFLAAVLSGTAAFGVMTFIMTATPLQMHTMSHYSLDQTAFVIQSHIIAMYLPSLFTGFLTERLGLTRLMLMGVLAMLGTVVVGVISRDLLHYWGALVLLGVGWNFLFVGGTVLLTRSYFPIERFKAQAANDFTIFGFQALASLSAGSVLFLANWDTLLMMTLPILLGIAGFILWLNRQTVAEASPAD